MRCPSLIRLSVLLPFIVSLQVVAQDYTLNNNNSSFGFNATNGGAGPAGATSWVVDGVNQLNFQSFYYRIGNGQEYALDNITSTPFVNFTGSQIDVTYSNANFSLSLTYDLFGNQAGSQKSGLGYHGQIVNKQPSASLDFHLFQYSDFNLGGIAGSQNVVMLKNGLGKFRQAGQTFGSMWMTNVIDMTPSTLPVVETGLFNSTLLSLTDAGQTIFSNTATNAGPGDVTYAFEFDFNLNPGSSKSFSGSFTMEVPEPSSLSLFVIAMLGMAGLSVRQNHTRH